MRPTPDHRRSAKRQGSSVTVLQGASRRSIKQGEGNATRLASMPERAASHMSQDNRQQRAILRVMKRPHPDKTMLSRQDRDLYVKATQEVEVLHIEQQLSAREDGSQPRYPLCTTVKHTKRYGKLQACVCCKHTAAARLEELVWKTNI